MVKKIVVAANNSVVYMGLEKNYYVIFEKNVEVVCFTPFDVDVEN